jgi:hypothetical protein
LKQKTSWFEHLTPFLAAVFPVLSLAYENIEFVQFISIIRSLLFSTFAVYTLYFIFFLIIRNWNKASVLSSLSVFLLLSYGNIYLLIEDFTGEVVKHRFLLGLFGVVFFTIALLVSFRLKSAKNINKAILTGGVVISIYFIISIGWFELRQRESAEVLGLNQEVQDIVQGIEELPDIYLIVLDAHTRSDVLKDVYNHDNSLFIQELEKLGFHIADCAHSNYPLTTLSMGSIFAMDYFHNIYDSFSNVVLPPLSKTPVVEALVQTGYVTVAFDNYYFDHFGFEADYYYSKEKNLFGSINEFEEMLVQTTVLRLILDMEGLFPTSWVQVFKDDIFLSQYRDSMYSLDTIKDLPDLDSPQFVYLHLMATHSPYAILADGSFGNTMEGPEHSYIDAVTYIDSVIPGILEEIISESNDPPIIILIGDHGPIMKNVPIEERLSILHGVYMQGEEPVGFYDSSTSVNSFRRVFNYLFDVDLELLEDQSYGLWQVDELGDLSKEVDTSYCVAGE